MCRTVAPTPKPVSRDLRRERMRKAAQDPGVREFEGIVVESLDLKYRLEDFFEEHDAGRETDSMIKLDIATREESLPYSQVPDLVRDLRAIHYMLESALERIVGVLHDDVFPAAMGSANAGRRPS